MVRLHPARPMLPGNINHCYICANWVTEKDSDKLYFDYFPPTDYGVYNEDICEDCEKVVQIAKENYLDKISSIGE